MHTKAQEVPAVQVHQLSTSYSDRIAVNDIKLIPSWEKSTDLEMHLRRRSCPDGTTRNPFKYNPIPDVDSDLDP